MVVIRGGMHSQIIRGKKVLPPKKKKQRRKKTKLEKTRLNGILTYQLKGAQV
jgi:hypothetical protein